MYSGPLPSLPFCLSWSSITWGRALQWEAWALGFECGLCSHACALPSSCWALTVGKGRGRSSEAPGMTSTQTRPAPPIMTAQPWHPAGGGCPGCLHSSGLLCWAGSQRCVAHSAAVKSSGGLVHCVSPPPLSARHGQAAPAPVASDPS